MEKTTMLARKFIKPFAEHLGYRYRDYVSNQPDPKNNRCREVRRVTIEGVDPPHKTVAVFNLPLSRWREIFTTED